LAWLFEFIRGVFGRLLLREFLCFQKGLEVVLDFLGIAVDLERFLVFSDGIFLEKFKNVLVS